MFRQRTRVFRDLNLAIDLVGLELLWLFCYYLRFYWMPVSFFHREIIPLQNYSWIFIFFPLIWILASLEAGLYRTTLSQTGQVTAIFRVVIFTMLLTIAFSFLLRKFEYSRLIFTYFAFLSLAFLLVHRWIWSALLKRLIQKGLARRTILLDSGTGMGRHLASQIEANMELGISLLGYIPLPELQHGQNFPGLARLGEYGELERILKDHQVQCVLVCMPLVASATLEKVLKNFANTLVDIVFVPDLPRTFILNQKVESVGEFSFFHLQTTRLVGWNLVLKRAFDFLATLIFIIAFSPLFALIAAAIKLNSRGPVFFMQTRFGWNEKEFKVFKFRTMVQDAPAAGQLRAAKNDPRVTSVGRILRKTSLDELPNLFNVLKGEMSLVGPRPEPAGLFEKVKESNPLFTFRHKFKPGMTGWAQVNGLRGGDYLEKKFEYDIYYIRNWSLLFDLKILVMTTWKGFYHPDNY